MLRRLLVIVLACGILPACRKADAPPVGTGAREVVTKYFEALSQQDWPTAYALLHADTQKQQDRSAFERSAQAYRDRLGFPLGKVTVRSCDELGEKAIAQVLLSDATGSVKNRYRDGLVLRRAPDGWRIVLPENFGQAK